jgi:hypothetical protein
LKRIIGEEPRVEARRKIKKVNVLGIFLKNVLLTPFLISGKVIPFIL